ncbi:hypothetical protein ACS0TY_036497 [Phlomoides rotata]
MFVSLFCTLKHVTPDVKKWRPTGADRGFTFVKYNLTITYHRTNLLARYVRRKWEVQAGVVAEANALAKNKVMRRQTTFALHHASHPWSRSRILIWMVGKLDADTNLLQNGNKVLESQPSQESSLVDGQPAEMIPHHLLFNKGESMNAHVSLDVPIKRSGIEDQLLASLELLLLFVFIWL